ncbi:MAG TPA: glycosyltransferase [Pyrinomonadaceae bacterium]|nr:glycosyltransferase [Pyrinomonadaceae bacterium]
MLQLKQATALIHPALKPIKPARLTNPRILLSHDTFGLGNIRRTLLLAQEVIEQYPKAAVLLVTGSQMIHSFRIPEGVDYIKLPCLDRIDAERYESRFLLECSEAVKRTRRAIIERTVLGFAPDLMIVDKRPAGVDGELTETLTALRNSKYPTRLVLGVCDILDEPRKTREALRNNHSFEIIRDYYDEVWIYGSRTIFDTVSEYDFPDEVARITHYCGYLKRPTVVATSRAVQRRSCSASSSRLKRMECWLVCLRRSSAKQVERNQAERLTKYVDFLPDVSIEEQARAVRTMLARKRINGIHAYFAHRPAEVAQRAARMLGVPFGFSTHARDCRKVAPEVLGQRARDAACVVACNTDVARDIRALGSEVHLLPHGVDLQRFSPRAGSSNSLLRLLAVGRLVEKKGFHFLIAALAAVDHYLCG